jgi:hypothetical protein
MDSLPALDVALGVTVKSGGTLDRSTNLTALLDAQSRAATNRIASTTTPAPPTAPATVTAA